MRSENTFRFYEKFLCNPASFINNLSILMIVRIRKMDYA